MATGDSNDVTARIISTLPFSWFGFGPGDINATNTPNIYGVIQGFAYAYSLVYSIYAYAKLQTRIATATDGWLDMIAADFFGTYITRAVNMTDAAFRSYIVANLLRAKATRAALIATLTTLTGRAPLVFEPSRPADTGGYGVACWYGYSGNPNPPFALSIVRASVATVFDHDNQMQQCLVNEARFTLLRRVQNFVSGSSVTLATSTAVGAVPPTLSQVSTTLPDGTNGICLQCIWGASGDSRLRINLSASFATTKFLTGSAYFKTSPTGTWVRAGATASGQGASIFDFSAVSGILGTYSQTVYVTWGQVEDVTASLNQNPGPYVSIGVLSAPFGGAGIDGVSYFATRNGNVVRQNDVFQSSALNNWTVVSCSIATNYGHAPSGDSTVLLTSTASGAVRLYESVTGLTAGKLCVASVYAREGTAGVGLAISDGGGGSVAYVKANLVTGTAVGNGLVQSVAITPVGSGMYRVSMTFSYLAAQTTMSVGPWDGSTDSFGYPASASGATVEVCDPQIQPGEVASTYVPTTSAAVSTGIIETNVGAALPDSPFRGFSNEPASTNQVANNTMVGAVAGSPGTLPTGWFNFTGTVSNGITSQVIGTGIEGGLPYIDINWAGTPTASQQQCNGFFVGSSSVAAAAAQTWTESVFVKLSANSLANVSGLAINGNAYASGLTYLGAPISLAIAPTGVSLGSQRVQVSGTMPATTAYVTAGLVFNVTAGQAINVTLRIGAPQLEQLPVATSPILTSGSALARSGDRLTTPIPFGMNAVAGMAAVEFSSVAPSSYPIPQGFFAISDGTLNNRIDAATNQNVGSINFAVVSGGTLLDNPSGSVAYTPNAIQRYAVGYGANLGQAAFNGGAIIQGSTNTAPLGATTFDIGNQRGVQQVCGTIRKAVAYQVGPTTSDVQAASTVGGAVTQAPVVAFDFTQGSLLSVAYDPMSANTGKATLPNYGCGYGSLLLPYQCFVTAYRQSGSGIPLVAGYGISTGGYSQPSRADYGSLSQIQAGVSDASIYAAIDAVKPVATIEWTRLSN